MEFGVTFAGGHRLTGGCMWPQPAHQHLPVRELRERRVSEEYT